MSSFKEIDISTLNENFFRKIGKEWMLITAGDKDKFNTMTASWGGIGVIWGVTASFCFIRQSRYTHQFISDNDYYTLSFFGGKMMEELTYCGKNSGRDVNKIQETGLLPVFDEQAPYFEQAELVLICQKMYSQSMTPENFADKTIVDKMYSDSDWHDMFIGKIVKVIAKV